jgi:sporulation protein YlmC with PRC-barrel domain
MLLSFKDMVGNPVNARDGHVGKVEDVLFEDTDHRVKHVVIDTHRWMPGKRVIVPPRAVTRADAKEGLIDIDLTKQQLEDSPEVTEDMPVSMQHEVEHRGIFQPMAMWYNAGVSPYTFLEPLLAMEVEALGLDGSKRSKDPHLRSAAELMGYHVKATDGDVGRVDDVLLDTEHWKVQYLIVDTHELWPGGKVLVSTDWLKEVSWEGSWVRVDHTMEAIRAAPHFDHKQPVTREYEDQLHDHYGRLRYW